MYLQGENNILHLIWEKGNETALSSHLHCLLNFQEFSISCQHGDLSLNFYGFWL